MGPPGEATPKTGQPQVVQGGQPPIEAQLSGALGQGLAYRQSSEQGRFDALTSLPQALQSPGLKPGAVPPLVRLDRHPRG